MATFLAFLDSKLVTEADSATIPRPEYPRPQFVREEWANLNGQWQFQTDDRDIGLEQSWFSSPDYPLTIQVPFAPPCNTATTHPAS